MAYVPVRSELRLVPDPARGVRVLVAGVGGQQRLQQRASELGQPCPQRQLCPLESRPCGQ